MARRMLIAGNWKMNGLQASRADGRGMADADLASDVEVLVCPPFTLLADVARDLATSDVVVGGQDCHPESAGAFTGDVSAQMLADAGARYVIVAHSERRAGGETDEIAHAKAMAATHAGLTPIICVGETLAERDAGRAELVVRGQVEGSTPTSAELNGAGVVVAYEPVWAIGTGRTPTLDDIAAMHAAIRNALIEVLGEAGAQSTRILYGGSVKPANAADILALAGVDGALVGGASLKAADFNAIIAARPRVDQGADG